MGNKAGKIWGETELILANNSLEFHRIDYKKGGLTLAQAVERFSKLTGIDAPISEKYIRGLGRDNIISLNSERQNRASKSEETDDRTG